LEPAASWLTGTVQVALSSLGGLAGFAVAAAFAWRLFVFFRKPAATFASVFFLFWIQVFILQYFLFILNEIF
jgi:hypothetical protein